MPLHDFRCTSCSHVQEKLVKWDQTLQTCPQCGEESRMVFLQLGKLNYLAMGAQKNVSPEFTAKFDKMHKDETAKQKAFEKEHGAGEYYNRAPGS